MSGILSGPMFEPSATEMFKASKCSSCHTRKEGAHYNIYAITAGIDSLRQIFPEGEANDLNFALFSTSGVHGSYTRLDEIESGLLKYGDSPTFPEDEDWPDDWHGTELTVLIVHPRLVCLRYGTIEVKLADIPYLKHLQSTSWKAAQSIGAHA